MLQQPLAPVEDCSGLLSRTFVGSVVLALLLVVLAAARQQVIPWIIPTVGGAQ
jgi:hypothetical protein